MKTPSLCTNNGMKRMLKETAPVGTILQDPIVGLSACIKTEQLLSATSDGLLPDRLTGICCSFKQYAQLHLP